MSYRTLSVLFLSCSLAGGLLGCEAPSEPDDASEEADVSEAASALQTKPPTKPLVREWTRWAMNEPWTTGPIQDATGAACQDGQDGRSWFLAGTTGGPVSRNCTIPAGKDLFFPLVNSWCVFPPEFYPDKASIEADLPAIAEFYADNRAHTCSLTVKVDGQDVYSGGLAAMDEELYVLVDVPFEIDMNADNFISQYGVAGGEMPATSSGHFARLGALPPGDHVVELGGSRCDGGDTYFETSATYHLHVEERN